MTNTNIARAERRLRLYLEKHGRGSTGYAYHACCGPHYTVTKEQFATILTKLHDEGFAEILDGVRAGSLWIVRKDLVDQTIADGVTL